MQLYQDECGWDTRWDRRLAGELVIPLVLLEYHRNFGVPSRVLRVRVPQVRVPATLPVSCTVLVCLMATVMKWWKSVMNDLCNDHSSYYGDHTDLEGRHRKWLIPGTYTICMVKSTRR